MGALVFFSIFLAGLTVGPILFRLVLWPVYTFTGGRLRFREWWERMGPL